MAFDLSMPILVVDDYSTMIRILRNLLKQIGFENVDDASDGSAALAKMQSKKYGQRLRATRAVRIFRRGLMPPWRSPISLAPARRRSWQMMWTAVFGAGLVLPHRAVPVYPGNTASILVFSVAALNGLTM